MPIIKRRTKNNPNLFNLMDLEPNYDTFKKIEVSENHVVKHYITYEDSPRGAASGLTSFHFFLVISDFSTELISCAIGLRF